MRFLLTGGSACGKSTYAERLAIRLSAPHYYLAAMQPFGAESLARIERHQKQRQGMGFQTIERYTDIGGVALPERGTVLLECLCNLTANEIYNPDGAGAEAEQAILDGVAELERQCENLIVVTNDIGSDGAEYDSSVLEYIEILGRINRQLAACYDHVYEFCCGFPIVLKGELCAVKDNPFSR